MPKNKCICDCHALNEKLVEQTQKAIPGNATIKMLADFFDILGNNTRCKILFALKETPLCVCDLANVLSMTKSSVSHQLNTMKKVGVVKSERNGKRVCYALDDDHVTKILETSFVHVEEKCHEK